MTPLTLNFFDEFAPKKAAPKTIASSALMCVPTFDWLPIIYVIKDCNFGILELPPMIYTPSISSGLRSWSNKNRLIGFVISFKVGVIIS